ncbi:hypothetical protein [Winogradskyella jejuensis]|uniref:Uncharacterized protein n=1 Tax=Winogradskyella jejuensis TaxID=1089305 RepID=A0A1M5SSH8_9FLAO|nr:hypothetical protein [Winogradskyella jejuensis]SHH41501.1 hypothetical protein SAMN05444148_1957 [Winogradskyella jejuensis]
MKTRNTMKVLASIALLMLMNLTFGQNDYLKITKSDKENDFIKYPPGSRFELTDTNNNIVYSDKSSEKEFIINQTYKLTVYPTYKNTSNIYYLSEGKIEIKSNAEYFKAIKEHSTRKKNKQDYGYYEYDKSNFTNGLTMKKTLHKSSSNPKIYNATFEFNNGITMTYIDGEMTAEQNGEPLKIEGNYIIYTKSGVIKLSYRPTNGETWWFFKTYKN